MSKIDASKIKQMTNNLVAYQIYEREDKMRKSKLKHFAYVFLGIALLFGGTFSVDALTNNTISNVIKDALTVKINGNDYNAKCGTAKDGKMVCSLDESVLGDKKVEFEVNEDDHTDIKIEEDYE